MPPALAGARRFLRFLETRSALLWLSKTDDATGKINCLCDGENAAAVTDTIKQVGREGRVVERTLERSRLWAVQTPQVFRREALARALSAPPDLIASATDDAWLVERQGGTVAVLPASAENFKITTPLDLRLAEMLLRERDAP